MPPGSKPLPPGEAKRKDRAAQWVHADGTGWKGRKPACPSDLTDAGKDAWRTWFASWWAGFWTPEDLPGLRLAVKLYDGALSGHTDVSKCIPLLDRYGITPKGRQDLRWAPPKGEAEPAPVVADDLAAKRADRSRRVV